MPMFKGLFATPITPFDKSGNIYEDGILNVVRFLDSHRIKNLFCLGSWGGFVLMNEEERKRTTQILVSECKIFKMNIIINVSATTPSEAIRLAKNAQYLGADAVASLVPFYYSSSGYTDENYLDYFERLVEAVDIPVHFYNNPRTTGYTLTSKFFRKLIDIGISGMKEGGGNQVAFIEMMDIIKQRNLDFDMIPGSVTMFLTGLLYGVKATMAGSSVVFPEIAVKAFSAFEQGETEQAVLLHAKLMRIRRIQNSKGMGAAACYGLLRIRGIDAGYPRSPWLDLSQKDLESFHSAFNQIGVL